MASRYVQQLLIILLGGIISVASLFGCMQAAASGPIGAAAFSVGLPATNTPASPTVMKSIVASKADGVEPLGGRPAEASTPSAALTPTATALALPALITEIPLAPEDEQITRMLLDSDAKRLYVTDSSGQLHILDSENYEVLQQIPVAPEYNHRLTLAADHDKLFVAANAFSVVVDTRQLTISQVISPGGYIALDPARKRFFIGSRWADRPVRMYDLADLSLISTLVQTGTPFYNPAREELYLLSDQVQAIDLRSMERVDVPLGRKLLAPIGFHSELHFLPESNQLILDVIDYFSISGRPASTNYYSFFAADSLSEISDPDTLPHSEFSCFGGLIVPEAIPGVRIHYDPFEAYRFQVEDENSGERAWYEGVRLGRTNARTRQIYHQSMVFELGGVKPVGVLPVPACIEWVEPETGRLFGVRKGNLVVFSESGGGPPNLPPLPVERFSTGETNLRFSPTYSQDQTIIVDGRHVYRSTDGGQSWVQLRGGLPVPHDSVSLTVTFSPNFAEDRTLFAVQPKLNQELSFGLYRSVDGGDSWQPVNEGLTRLGVFQVKVSPDFGLDQTLLIDSAYNSLADKYLGPYAFHYSTLRSTDGGQSWTQVVTRTDRIGLPVPPLPAAALPTTHFRWVDRNQAVIIQRSQDGGVSWADVFTLPDYADPTSGPPDRQVITVSPNFANDLTVFIYLQDKIYRSVDGGERWEAVSFSEWPLSMVLSPNFAVDQTVYGYDSEGFYRSVDRGATWASITPDRPPASVSNQFFQLVFSPHFVKNRLMLSWLGAHIFSATDGGESWRSAALPATETEPSYIWYIRNIIFSPDPDILFALYGAQLFRSADQGQTWSAVLPYNASIFHFSPGYSDDRTLYFLWQDLMGLGYSKGGILFRSTDGGASWQQWNVAEALLGSDSDRYIDQFLISPAGPQGQHHLFLVVASPADRQIIRLDPAEAAWGSVIEPTPTPTP